MCLGIPMRIVELADNSKGRVELDGVTYEVSLMMIEEPQVGEYVIVHAGFAIERLDPDEAEKTLDYLRQVGTGLESPNGSD